LGGHLADADHRRRVRTARHLGVPPRRAAREEAREAQAIGLADVQEVVGALAGLRFWLDGGWGVDALLGEQTRAHSDLDVALDRRDVAEAQQRLTALGFAHAPEIEPGLPARYVLCDARGRQIDLHPLDFDGGDGWQQLPDGRRGRYPASELGFTGRIGGVEVPCISPALQLRHHQGYAPTERDRRDMGALAKAFALELPQAFEAGA
jgi:lincosamide nucleotidyltransferase A/C/D/E